MIPTLPLQVPLKVATSQSDTPTCFGTFLYSTSPEIAQTEGIIPLPPPKSLKRYFYNQTTETADKIV